jgi:hypothetical protein
MGMFDEILCEHVLPDRYDPGDTLFQTKDLDNAFQRYTITHDGRLIAHRVRYEPEPEDRHHWLGSLKTLQVGDEEVPFHGDIRMYRSNIGTAGPEGIAALDDARVERREYVVRFTNGRVEWIRGGLLDESDRPHLTRAEMHGVWSAPEGKPAKGGS